LLALLAVGASGANPIRRVVSLLQDMQKKIEAEGERDKELFDKFICYCQTGAGDLEKSIKAAETKMPAVTSALQEATSQKEQLEVDLDNHKGARSDAKSALAEATAIREKEAAAYAKESGEKGTNIKALGKAIDAISSGMGSFLQTGAAEAVRRLTIDMDLSSADRDIMASFLSQKQAGSYAPASGQITGILRQMKDTMEADLAGLTKEENAAKAAFEGLTAAKEKEIAANSKAIEDKTARHGKVGVQIENLREDLEDTSASYAEDKKFLADLDKNCATKKEEWDVVKKTRAEEMLAIADTIKILNDDDALDLFKKTLSTPSLLQTTLKSQEVKKQALRALQVARHGRGHGDSRLDLIALAIRGKKVSFDKVVTMIDDMVKLLGEEQVSDDSKKAYCEKELDKNEDTKKELDLDVSDLTKAIAETEEAIATFGEEIEALVAGIKALDKSVSEATANRKAENEEYKSTMAANTAAKELIQIAKNRMQKFYNPKMYKAPPKRELSAEDRIYVNNGGTEPPTEAPGGIAGTGVTALVEVRAHAQRSGDVAAPPPPPETFGPYTKKGQESSGVLTMMDMLVADLDKEMQEMGVEEKDAQADYESYIADSAEKRATDSKSIEEKESAKAAAEEALNKANLEKKSKSKEAMATAMILKDLHLECDWLVANFETRKQARAGEVDSLKKAKAVLSGADYALLQTSRRFLDKRRA